MAEREGFEPPVPLGTRDFESRAFDQLGHRSVGRPSFVLQQPGEDKPATACREVHEGSTYLI
jgi:hypothetical protein